ncbi:MAG: protein-S-isoprenylcysteine O-methyltransferase [Steroidobacteraceae bacterium]
MQTGLGPEDQSVIGATSARSPIIQLAIAVGATVLYLWRTDLDPRWPVLAGIAAICVYVMVRAPHARRAAAMKVDGSHVTGLDKALIFGVIATTLRLPQLYLAVPLFDRLDYALPGSLAVAGVAIMSVALWLFRRSHADLGTRWSASLQLGDKHELVTRGVYARVRHPMYAALWLYVLAQPLLFQNWVAGPPAILGFSLLYFIRVPREEAMMRERFGVAYNDYAERTRRLWPARRK